MAFCFTSNDKNVEKDLTGNQDNDTLKDVHVFEDKVINKEIDYAFLPENYNDIYNYKNL